jgi:hypothetical protein
MSNQMTLGEQKQRLALKAIWRRLPTEPVTCHSHAMVDHPLLRAIIDASNGRMYEHDYASASVKLHGLVSIGAVKGVLGDNNMMTYTRATEFPEPPDDGLTWTERENKQIRERVKRDEALRLKEWEAAEAAQKAINAPYIAAEQAGFARYLRDSGMTERIEKIEQTLVRLEAAINTEARDGAPQEVAA